MKRPFYIALFVTILVVASYFVFPGFIKSVDGKWVDNYFSIRGPLKPANNVVIVAIDEQSINAIGRWPWSRQIMARLVEKLEEYGVKALGFDITFSETSPEDGELAAALKKISNTTLGYFFYATPQEAKDAHLSKQELEENDQTIFSSRLSMSSKQLETSGEKVYGVQTNVPQIVGAVSPERQGFFNVFPDPDGVIRRAPLILAYKGNFYPSLSLQSASLAVGFSPLPILNEEGVLQGIALGNQKIPLNDKGELFINYRGGTKSFPHISIADILNGSVPKETLKDKIILVGATAIGIYDMRVAPTDAVFPGIEVSANVVDNILSGDFIVSDTTTKLISFGLILFVGFFLGLVIPRFHALGGFFVFLVSILLISAAGYFCFLKGYLIHSFGATLNGTLVYGGITIYRFFTEEKERRKIKKTFQHYLSPSVIKVLLEHPEQLKLGGDRKELTVLFSDIRGFTSKSEKLPPEKVVQLLNDYFTVMTDVVFEHEGTVDKYMGDAIMAIFGAPLPQEDHALRASLTALEMIEKLDQHREEWCKKYGIDELKIGVGVHTGLMAVGNMGSARRFNYTVIGDSVNLTSRIEGLNKDYGTQIIISDALYQKVKDHVTVRELGVAKVKGKEIETKIYELVGRK